MMLRHEADFDLLVAGALLDDLDPAELARYEAHQAGCPRCAELGADLSATLGDLALVAKPRRPPAALGRSLLATIQADDVTRDVDAQATAAALARPTPIGQRRAPGRPRRSQHIAAFRLDGAGRIGWVAAAALLVIAIGAGAWGVSNRQELDRVAAETTRLRAMVDREDAVMTVALAPDHAIAALSAEPLAPAAEAMVVYRPGHIDGFIVVRALPPTPAGQVYQLWVADASGVHPLQTISYDGQGPLVAPIGRDLADSSAVMITLEPIGGAIGAPGPQVVFGEL